MTVGTWCLKGAALLVLSGVLGCGSQPQFAEEPYPDGGIDAAPPPPPAPTVDASAPLTQAGPCDPVQSLAMSTSLQARAPGEAPGMQPEGQATCGVVPEGQSVTSAPFMLMQGYCYTFLGQSLPPVTEVDIQLVPDVSAGLPPALATMANQPLLVDTETGDKAAMGAKQACYQWPWPFPLQGKLIVTARAGSGPVAAQVFRKKK